MLDDGGAMAVYEEMGANFLADQPPSGSAKPRSTTPHWNEIFGHLEARMQMMYNWRLSWWSHWSLLAQYILPRRYHWLITPNTMTRGNPINQAIVDPTGTQAMRVCVAGLMSGMSSPSRPWFKFKPATTMELDREAMLWFEEVEARMYRVMSSSNFYDSMAQLYEDLVVFGTAPMIIYEDARDVIRCYNPCAGEYFLAAGPTLRIETFNRRFVMTVAQIVEMFGIDNCPDDIRELWKTKGGSLENERIIAHAIEPNFPISNRGDGGEIQVLPDTFVYREVYWLWGNATAAPLSIRGFRDPPFIAPRWATTSNDPYGRSPGMDALPDIMQLQVETKRKAEAIEKQVRPPLLASVELKNEPSSILPGHVTYVSNIGAGQGMRPIYEVKPDLQYMTLDLQQIQNRVRQGFFNDLFLMLSQTQRDMTAFEVAQRQQEKLQVLGPVIERAQNEGFSPAIRRIFAIMARKGLLPPMPPSLRGVTIQVEYISMLALAQKAAATTGMEKFAAMSGNLGAIDSSIYDNINRDEFIRVYADLLTVPTEILNGANQVEAMRAKRQQDQAAQAAEARAMALAKEGVEGAKTLSATEVGGGQNALQMLLGNAGVGGRSRGQFLP